MRARKRLGKTTFRTGLKDLLAERCPRHSRKEIEARLADEYREGDAESHRVSHDFAAIDKEVWDSLKT